jgi:hypothetical protein
VIELVEQHIAYVLLAIMVLVAAVSIYRYEKNPSNNFNLVDLLLEDGRLSKWSLIIMLAFAIHSWALVVWVLRFSASTQDFLAYGGVWITPLIAKMFVPKTPSDPPA